MAAPNNLSLRSPFTSSTQQQSLRTPDASSLFSSSHSLPTPHDISLPTDVSSVNSLEDLLSFSGITNGPVPSKRPIDEVELPNSKRIKTDDSPQDHIPSILPQHSTSGLIPSILHSSKPHLPVVSSSYLPVVTTCSSSLNGGMVLPVLKTTLGLPSLSSSSSMPITVSSKDVTQKPFAPQLSSSHSTSSQFTPTISSNSSPNLTDIQTTNGGSVALLVQLYKHFQSTGDSAGMAKIHQQLLALHSQLATKAGAYLSSLTTTTTPAATATNNLLLGQINLSNNNSISMGTRQSVSTTNTGKGLPSLTSSNQVKTATSGGVPHLPTSNFLLHNPVTTTTTTANEKSTVQPSSTLNIVQPVNSVTGLIPSTSNSKSHLPSSTSLHGSVMSQTLPPPYTSISNSSAPPVLTNPLQFLSGSMTSTNNQGSLSSNTSTGVSSLSKTPLVTKPIDTVTKPSTPRVTSPSIVTHVSSSSSASTGLSPLPGLQVTAQTQANVLRAVYSYRIQRIQEFLASLPVEQRPTTTQELRELLTKNNILTKAFPPDIITSLQQQLPSSVTLTQSPILTSSTVTTSAISNTSTVSHSSPLSIGNILTSTNVPSTISSTSAATISAPITSTISVTPSAAPTISTTVNNGSSTLTTGGRTQSTVVTTNNTTVTTTNSNASFTSTPPSGPLPGVTLETLRTLCRLPEADLVRIPMPSMLLTVVQYMRANKWSGNSTDLPNIIQQAQEALAKGKLATGATPPPASTSTSSGSVKSTSQQPVKQPTVTVQQQKPANPSPLSQYMASVGIKVPTSVSSVKSTSNKPSSTVSIQAVSQNKTTPEQLEKDRLAALQKVLQSSEEARIAFRFQAHLDKLHQQVSSHEIQRPFATWQDLILRLLPYHIYREPELPPGAMEKADAVYEGIAGVLLSRSQGLMNQYQQILLREQQRQSEEEYSSLVLEKLWLEGERERKEQEEKQKREAEQIAAELSAVGRGTTATSSSSSFFDSTDPFLLDSDAFNDYPFLDQFWGDDFTDGFTAGDVNNFDLGIT